MSINARLIIWCLALPAAMATYIILWRWINRKLEGTASLKTYGDSFIFTFVAAIGSLGGAYLWDRWDMPLKTPLAYISFGVANWLGGLVALSVLEMLGLLQEFVKHQDK